MSVDMLTLRRKNGSCGSQPHAIVFEIDREQSAIPPFGGREISRGKARSGYEEVESMVDIGRSPRSVLREGQRKEEKDGIERSR
jgi:hypothetical protein